MNHTHIQLIDDPQWVSRCVENECSFRDHIQGYVCRTHCSRHICSDVSCSLIQTMVTRTRYQTNLLESSCPVTALLVFHKPQVEFRGSYYMPDRGDSIENGYGAIEHAPVPVLCYSEEDSNHLILKASLPAMIALFSTALSHEFSRQYEIVDKSQRLNTLPNTPSFSWMAKIFELAEAIQFTAKPELSCSEEMSLVVKDAVLKSTVAISTLFDSRDDKINRFMKRLKCKYNDKYAKRAHFHTMVVMLTLCFFPYLKHRVLGELFNNRALVLMCFDKTRTRHHQWSTLSTHIHLHVNRPEIVRRVLSNSDLGCSLPVVVTVTLEKYILDATYSSNETMCSMAHSPTHREHHDHHDQSTFRNQTDARPEPSLHRTRNETKKDKSRTRKRRTPCSTGYYEMYEGRLEEKVVHLATARTSSPYCCV